MVEVGIASVARCTTMSHGSLCFSTDGPLDTSADLVTKRTYIPSLMTFEEDIVRSMGLAVFEQTKEPSNTSSETQSNDPLVQETNS